MTLKQLFSRLHYRRTDEVFYQFFNCLLNGQDRPQVVFDRSEYFIRLLECLEKSMMKKPTLIERVKTYFGKKLPLTPFTKALLTAIFVHEGFQVVFFNDTDVLREYIVAEEHLDTPIIEKHDRGGNVLLYTRLRKYRPTTELDLLGRKRQITDTLKIEKVYVANINTLTYDVIDSFLLELSILRWNDSEMISVF